MQPQYPQQYAPQPGYGQPAAAPQYAGYPPVQQQSQHVPNANSTLSDPTGGGGTPGPSVRHYEGRVVIVTPVSIDHAAKDKNDKPRPSAIYNVAVMDGPVPMTYGENMDEGTPPTHRVDQLPCEWSGLIASNTNFVRALADKLNQGGGPLVGFVVRSTVGNRPYNLQVIDPNDPVLGPRKAAAVQWWAAKQLGQVPPNPTPVELAPATQQAPPIHGYGQPMSPQLQPPAQPQYAGYPPAVVQGMAPIPPAAMPQWPAQQMSAPPVAEIPCPTGWDPSMWASFSVEQRQQIVGNMATAAPAAAGMGAPPPF